MEGSKAFVLACWFVSFFTFHGVTRKSARVNDNDYYSNDGGDDKTAVVMMARQLIIIS